jgi:hypothetical protein
MHTPPELMCAILPSMWRILIGWLAGCRAAECRSWLCCPIVLYCISLYDILEERGFEVYVVNARHTKNLPGRKSDVQEKLHTYGLLNKSFQPISEIRVPRTYSSSDTTTRHWSGDQCSTNAESTDADEHSVSKCDQRFERSDTSLWGD